MSRSSGRHFGLLEHKALLAALVDVFVPKPAGLMRFAEARRISQAPVTGTFRMLRDAAGLALCCDPRRVDRDMPVGALLLVILHVRHARAPAVKAGKRGYDA